MASETIKLDGEDLQILAMLEKDSKVRIGQMARRIGMPASTVHHRIKRLESEGIIAGYGIRKNYRKMGFGIKAHVLVFVDVTVLKRLKKTQQDIASALLGINCVESAEIITGEADLLATVRARDMDDFRKVLLDKIQSIEGITETRTMMAISE